MHTPGPWRVRFHPAKDDDFHVSAVAPEDHPYFGVTKECQILSDEDYPTKLADAHLVSAAPELYQLLDECINGLDCQPGYVKSLTIQRAQAVLRKARGEK